MEPPKRFTADAVRKHVGEEDTSQPGQLNEAARQIAAQFRRDTTSPIMVSGILRIVEVALLFASGMALFVIYVGLGTELDLALSAIAVATASLIAVIMLEVADCYQLPALTRPASSIAAASLLVWAGTLALLALTGFFLKIADDFSRVWFGGWFVAGLVLLFVLRLVLARLIRRWARNGAHGAPRRDRRRRQGGREQLIRSIEQQPDNDIRICGIFDDRDDERSPPIVAGYPKLGTIAELVEFARIARIDMLIVSLPLTAENARAVAAEEALGAAGRHPPVGAFQPAAVPPALLFLYRLGADARHLRQADHRLGFGRQARCSTSSSACIGIVAALAGDARRPRSPSSSTARGRCSSSRSATASTTRSSRSTSSARCTPSRPTRPRAGR